MNSADGVARVWPRPAYRSRRDRATHRRRRTGKLPTRTGQYGERARGAPWPLPALASRTLSASPGRAHPTARRRSSAVPDAGSLPASSFAPFPAAFSRRIATRLRTPRYASGRSTAPSLSVTALPASGTSLLGPSLAVVSTAPPPAYTVPLAPISQPLLMCGCSPPSQSLLRRGSFPATGLRVAKPAPRAPVTALVAVSAPTVVAVGSNCSANNVPPALLIDP